MNELMEKLKEIIGKPTYGIIENGIFGTRIVSGIITGIKFTEGDPVFEISFGKDKWWTSEITDDIEDILKIMKLTSLERVAKTHGLKIKYDV